MNRTVGMRIMPGSLGVWKVGDIQFYLYDCEGSAMTFDYLRELNDTWFHRSEPITCPAESIYE